MIYDSGILREAYPRSGIFPLEEAAQLRLRQSIFGKFRAYSTGLVKSLLFGECFI